MDLFLISNIFITIALLIQLYYIQNINYKITSLFFLLFSISTLIMAYAQYKYNDDYKINVPIKLFNGIISLVIFMSLFF
jgi:4-hydroxybenzoate polyprenyltransferase